MKVEYADQETIITFNRAEKEARIFTYEPTWKKHLEKNLGLKPIMDNGCGGREYIIDKKRIFMPRAPRKLSAETKKKYANNLKRYRFSQKSELASSTKNTETPGR